VQQRSVEPDEHLSDGCETSRTSLREDCEGSKIFCQKHGLGVAALRFALVTT